MTPIQVHNTLHPTVSAVLEALEYGDNSRGYLLNLKNHNDLILVANTLEFLSEKPKYLLRNRVFCAQHYHCNSKKGTGMCGDDGMCVCADSY